jgi:hypothetical protein
MVRAPQNALKKQAVAQKIGKMLARQAQALYTLLCNDLDPESGFLIKPRGAEEKRSRFFKVSESIFYVAVVAQR